VKATLKQTSDYVIDASSAARNLTLGLGLLLGNVGNEGGGFFLNFDDAVDGSVAMGDISQVGRRLIDVAFPGLGL
jgi:hypothetical protein